MPRSSRCSAAPTDARTVISEDGVVGMTRLLQGRHVRVRNLVGVALDGVYIAASAGGVDPCSKNGAALRLGRNAGSSQERVHEPLSEIIVAHAGIYSGFLILDTLRAGVPFGNPL